MPTWMPHLFVAKKVNPNAKTDFYIGNLAPDSPTSREKRDISHLRNSINMESELREFALKIDTQNEYLKGVLLHIFVDWKWESLIVPAFIEKIGEGWHKKMYWDEGDLVEAHGFHSTDWAYELWEQMDLCNTFDYIETHFIRKEDIKTLIRKGRKWMIQNKSEPSSIFTPVMLDNFASDTADSFIKWFADLAN